MSFDNSRFTFNPLNDYFGVVMEQGRVQLDSDWNEWLAELNRRIQAGTLDTLGRAVYPATTPYAFQITATATTLMIGPGRMYVDGILVENHGDPAAAVWDPALAEMSDAPQPPLPAPSGGAAPTGSVNYLNQPHPPTATLPTTPNPFLAYLDVWTRPVTYLEDPNLIDSAVGVDTTGRLQTAWQVKLLPVPAGTTCLSSISGWPPPPSAGLLSTTTTPNTPSGPCCVNDSSGYTGMENQFYRVEIHQAGTPAASSAALPFTYPLPAGVATFKWSRDNASVMTGVTNISAGSNSAGAATSKLTVLSLGRDQTLGFAPGNWIEILDDTLEFSGGPRELCLIDSVDLSSHTITLTAPLTTTFPADPTTTHTRIIRWDQAGKVFESDGTKLTNLWIDVGANNSTGDIPVPPPGTMLVLENGVTVFFDENPAGGSFLLGDFWTFAARTADGKVETLAKAPPRGIHHHYAALSIVDFSIPTATDCRTEWPPAAAAECGCCCTNTVGVGAKYTSIQAAINALPAAGGEVCILPGIYYEYIFLEGLSDVVLHGCGWQTRIVSPALNPANSPGTGGGGGTTTGAAPPYAAVITVSASQHIQMLDFAVEAGDQEVGILLDGSGTLGVTPPTTVTVTTAAPAAAGTGTPATVGATSFVEENLVVDTTIEDLVITASTMPAILAYEVSLLRIDDNRIAMQDVQSQWPAVWVLGSEIHIDRNWVGIQTPSSLIEWLPASVASDLQSEQNPATTSAARRTVARKAALKAGLTALQAKADFSTLGVATFGIKVATHPGGIQIAGPSHGVYVFENEIAGGGRNGITLGSFTTLDGNNQATGTPIGVVVNPVGPCGSTVSLETGGTTTAGGSVSVVSAGRLSIIQIGRNRIVDMGLCGIGPAGFFDTSQTTEVVSVLNLDITGNTIQNTLLNTIAPSTLGASKIGYGAICLPDVQNLIVRDNTISNFGDQPGAEVCGVYILHGEMIEINRNQITESRDWIEGSTAEEQPNTARGGIFVALATPPAFPGTGTSSLWTATRDAASAPIYEPSLPSLRVEHNVVRVPLSYTLYAFGYGPFSIVDNHLSCGGTVIGKRFQIAQTVYIVNLSLAIEIASILNFSQLNNSATTTGLGSFTKQPNLPLGGMVLFTNNICQLEEGAVRMRPSLASVAILSLDTIIFSNNQCWADGTLTALMDAFLLGMSVQVTSNRFQETLLPFAVIFSGVTIGLLNITAQNISTLCLLPYGAAVINVNNQCIIALLAQANNGQDPCAPFLKS
jgi:hypothetical protein